jgi:nitroimidazol reductase NimA-like FMN-containing flavoprotein (pyridoxamine 5'-phosphate oxidase superfamily)
MEQLKPTARTRVRRVPKRASYDRATVEAILDEGLICHLAFAHDDHPFCIPTIHARVGDTIYVHGSAAARWTRSLGGGCAPACLTVTHVDGIVLARSAFHHSMNFRSAMVVGPLRAVEFPDEKMEALHAFTERLMPGRWAEVRRPNRKELKATSVLAMRLEEASAKVRTGPPVDDEEDYGLGVWAGVLPVSTVIGEPEDDPRLAPGIGAPGYLDELWPSSRGSSSSATTRSTASGAYAESSSDARAA